MHIPELDLIALDDAALDDLLADPLAFLKRNRDSGELKDQILEVARQARDFQRRTGAQPPWIGYLAQEPETGHIVGACTYKGDPSAAGVVEIACFTFPPFEGYGVATGMAQELLARAFSDSAVTRVIAYTPRGPSSATRVMEKVGLRCAGDFQHPEEGLVWLWELSR